MKKFFLFLTVVLTMSACSYPEVTSTPGGIYVAEFDQRGEAALRFGLREMGADPSNYQLSLYKKQIVNGINHFFVVRVENTSYELKVYEELNGSLHLEFHREIQR